MSDEVKPDGPKDDNARSAMQDIAQIVDDKLPRGWGFFVLVCPTNGERGRTNYVSNLKRNDVIRVMKDQIKRFRDGQPFQHTPEKKEPEKLCVKHSCNKAKLILLHTSETLQTQNGFIIAPMKGYYCPVCAGCYGSYERKT